MKSKLSILILLFLFLAGSGYSQDSLRTKNDKPGTPQSLRAADQSPQSHVQIINPGPSPDQTTSESNSINTTTQQTIITNQNTTGTAVPTNPITIANKPPGRSDSAVKNSAIQNGISNASNPIRNK